MSTQTRRTLALSALVLAGIALMIRPGEAHKAITSKYTYNDDVFPILRERCASCHVSGGIAPMSLMTYDDAFPWAESIRAELVAAHMPPAAADEGFGEVAHARALTAKEVDVILTWASGGNPRGAIDQKLPPVQLQNEWVLGKPDVALPLPSEFTLAADKMEETREVTIPSGLTQARWVRAIDLLPGNPAIVRSAVIALKGTPERILARWLPGQEAPPNERAALRVPAGAELVVRIKYKKTWSYEGKAMADRSTVGLYFAPDADARELTTVTMPAKAVPAAGQAFAYDRALDGDVQLVAIDAAETPDDVTIQIEAVRPDGARTPLVRFVSRTDWARRYWLATPLALPRGTKIEVKGTVEDPELTSAAFGGPTAPRERKVSEIKLALDVVAAGSKPAAP